MNMHGVIEPLSYDRTHESVWQRTVHWVRRNRMIMMVVVAPSLLVAAYLYLVASDQYISEAHYIVRTADAKAPSGGGMAAMLSAATGSGGGASSEGMAVADYLTSHDAVDTLRRHDRLVERYHRSDADILSRLWFANPRPETLLRYYQRMVHVELSAETGITTLSVRGFRPQDSYELVSRLLHLGEQRVNEMNERSYTDGISSALRQVSDAENKLAAIQVRLSHFRRTRADIDPQATGTAQISLVKSIDQQLAMVRAQLQSMGASIDHASPQYRALVQRERALTAQVATQNARLVGNSNAIANDIGGFEDLKLRQTFLEKQYDAASAALIRAREQAQRQQLYVVRVVDPNVPVKPLYPQRARILGTVVVALFLVYAIGWLLAAGVREHAA